MKKTLGILTLLVMISSLSGCATLFGSRNHPISIRTEPEGAKVYVDSKSVGKSPLEYTFERNDDHVVEAKLEGYETARYELDRRIQPIFFLNIFFWPCGVVDFANNKMWRWDREEIHLDLERKDNASSPRPSLAWTGQTVACREEREPFGFRPAADP